MRTPHTVFRVAGQYQPILRELGIDAELIFTHPLIKPWRTLSDRENCTLDATLADGRTIRWHIKRYQPSSAMPAFAEVNGHRALQIEKIPVAELIGWGKLPDRRSFVIFDDLAGFDAADKLIEASKSFDRL